LDVATPTTYYDSIVWSVRYKGVRWPMAGWGAAHNSFSGMRLTVTDWDIEIRGLGPLTGFAETFGFETAVAPRDMEMAIRRLGAVLIGGFAFPWPKVEFVVLTRRRNGPRYTMAIRPRDREIGRLRDALRAAGVAEAA
jgi:hypothetical protein